MKAGSLKALTQQLQKYQDANYDSTRNQMDGERDMGHKNTHNIPEWKVKWEKGIWSCIYCKQGNEEEYTLIYTCQ
jgi:hypothetical protein